MDDVRIALADLCRHFPTDTDMLAAGWERREIDDACNAYDRARRALSAPGVPVRADPSMLERFSELLRGLKFNPSVINESPQFFFTVGRSIADQADSRETPAAENAPAPAFDLIAHIERAKRFSENTFGPGIRTAGVVDHIRKELREVEAAPTDLEEWVDVWMLALDGCWRAGYSAEQIVAQINAKQTKNEGRKWPDWRTVSRDKAIEHDRTSEVATPEVPAHPLPAQSEVHPAGLPFVPSGSGSPSDAGAEAPPSGWRQVPESMPADGWCIVRAPNSAEPHIWIADYRHEDDAFYPCEANGGWFETGEVSHWMPLPPAPKEQA